MDICIFWKFGNIGCFIVFDWIFFLIGFMVVFRVEVEMFLVFIGVNIEIFFLLWFALIIKIEFVYCVERFFCIVFILLYCGFINFLWLWIFIYFVKIGVICLFFMFLMLKFKEFLISVFLIFLLVIVVIFKVKFCDVCIIFFIIIYFGKDVNDWNVDEGCIIICWFLFMK